VQRLWECGQALDADRAATAARSKSPARFCHSIQASQAGIGIFRSDACAQLTTVSIEGALRFSAPAYRFRFQRFG
jgi:hypothetical protein